MTYYKDTLQAFLDNHIHEILGKLGREFDSNDFITLKSATTRLYDTEAKIICIVSKKGAQCIECHHKDI